MFHLTLRVAKTATPPHRDSSPAAQNDILKIFQLSLLDLLFLTLCSFEFAQDRLSMRLVKTFFKKYFTPPDASSDERCWPGDSFHRKVYGLAT